MAKFDSTDSSQAPGYGAGATVGMLTDFKRPMGSWTGLDPLLGAPISGALWGAGLGGLYGAGRYLWDAATGRPPRAPQPWWKTPWGLGLLAGGGLGLTSGVLQKMSSVSPSRLIEIIGNDPNTADFEKARLIGLVRQANGPQLDRMLGLAAIGGLTAAAAHNILGTGIFGSTLAGAAASYVFHNMYRPQR